MRVGITSQYFATLTQESFSGDAEGRELFHSLYHNSWVPTRITEVIQVVEAVLDFEAKQREAVSYFTKFDLWLYHAVTDTKLCDRCAAFHKEFIFSGVHLQSKFPYLMIVDNNTIRVNVHPNCRCYLTRLEV